MNNKTLPLLAACLTLALGACRPSDADRAEQYIRRASQMIDENRLNAARLQLDSVHELFPREVKQRREAKHLADTIRYIESLRTIAYIDSLLPLVEQEIATEQTNFRFQKDTLYQSKGSYLHRLLLTAGSNTQRCFLQPYVEEPATLFLRSVYCGSRTIGHRAVVVSSGDESVTADQSVGFHEYTDGGLRYEYLTLQGDQAALLLRFVEQHEADRIKITLKGESDYTYWLTETERQALAATSRFASLLARAADLQNNLRMASNFVAKFTAR